MPDPLSFRVRLTSGLAVLAVVAVIGALLGPAPASAAEPAGHAPAPQHDHVVPGHLARHHAGHRRLPQVRPFHPPAPVWPSAMTAIVRLVQQTRAAKPVVQLPPSLRRGVVAVQVPIQVRAGTSPVWLSPAYAAGRSAAAPRGRPAQVTVRVFSRATAKAAGVSGVLMRLTRSDGVTASGPVDVSLDYARFRYAYGGSWADRLQLVELTGCATTVPAPAGCHLTPLAFRNETAANRLMATVWVSPAPAVRPAPPAIIPTGTRPVSGATAGPRDSGAVFLAATSSPSGSAGSFAATPLQASSSWSAGGNSGNFRWNYPLRTPPGLGGPVPSLTLAYDSAAVDGEVASSNNQPSWVGQGFSLDTGYIERTYTACADDMGGSANNTVATGDMCWGASNGITLSLGGHSGELIQDPSNPNRYHLRHDDGTYVSLKTGASNGDNNGEYWVVTTTSGVQYWFGKDTSGNNSAWTEPVYGNNPGEPCHASTFAASSCAQAWRWNLDHVVDPSGNTLDLYYTAETNMYAADDNVDSPVSYVRGGYLNKITYGTRTGSTGNPPMQVVFTRGDRCVTSSCGTHDGVNWPDTPWDMQCTAAPCYIGNPTFWNTDALATVSTQLYSGTGTTYNTVTSWTLTHTMPDPGDGTDPALWLSSIVQTGQDGSPSIALAPVTLTPVQLSNRVDTLGGALPPMNWMRMATITTETGSQIQVTYNPSTCLAGTSSMPDPANLQKNTYTCYPVIWTPPGDSSPITDFFNKYTVAQVNTADLTTPGNPTTVTSYKYLGNPAWHYTDTTGIVPAKDRTWSVWRGYPQVETDTGTGSDEQSLVTTYFQGMNGDYLPGGGSRSVTLPAIDVNENGTTTDAADAAAVPDDDAFAGMVRETVTNNGLGGAEVKAVVTNPWESTPTASTSVNGMTINARFTGIQNTHTRIDLDGGRAPLTTSTLTVFDSMGLPVQQQDNGNDAVTGDEKCTLTSYARNMATDGSVWLGFPDRVQRFATDCATAQAGGLAAAQVISDTLTYYDGATTASTPPTAGLVTRADVLKDWVNTAPVYLTTSTQAYDPNGRVISYTDVRGNTTTTAYTENSGGELLTTTTTNALGWQTATTTDPATGQPVHTVDPNGRVTDESYDALGRLVSVWEPGRDKSSQSPNVSYSYLVRDNAPSVVTTSKLVPSGGYLTSYQLYDGMVRPIQTQQPRGDGAAGALVTDTFYDSAGMAYQVNSPYLAAITPGTTLFVANEQNVPQRTVTSYDGVGRPVTKVVYNLDSHGVSVPFATTTTAYGGDRTDVTPPAGGVATSTYTDVWGNTVALRQYHGAIPTPGSPGSYDETTYTYDTKNQLVTVTDPAGNKWTTTYDIRGRVTATTDPDTGATHAAYDDAGDVTSATDARGVTLNYSYDSLGRKTGVYNGAINSADQLAAWVYDGLSNSRGQLTKTISYDNGNAYTMAINGFTATYQPTSVNYAIPAAETGLAGSYTYVYTYNPDGSLATTRLPDVDGAGGLALETLTTQYNGLGEVSGLSTSIPVSTSLVPSVSYTGYGEPAVMTLQTNGGNQVYLADTYDPSNRRVIEESVTKQTSPTAVSDTHYSYDPSGNLLSEGDSVSGANQCFGYDYADRLTSAWTPANGDCAAAKSVSALGGPAAYWDDWTFSAAGSRISQVAHDTANGAATTGYTVPAPGAAQPHSVTSTTMTNNTGSHTASYSYDAGGYMTSRPSPSGPANQTLTYNPQGMLSSVSDNGSATSYTYDANGGELIERDQAGKTLYLPGQELRYTASTGAKSTIRYYTVAGQTIAMRTASGLTWMVVERQNTVSIAIDNTTQAVAQQWLDPYGNLIASSGSTWPAADTKGFVGGTPSADGLTTLGARAYDPVLGRFTSVDPIRSDSQPQRFDGYAYCADNPVGMSDPTGLTPPDDNPDPWPGAWWWEYGTEYDYDQGGYHYQVFDGVYFSCRNEGAQCWGWGMGFDITENQFYYIGPNGERESHLTMTWIDMNPSPGEYAPGDVFHLKRDRYKTTEWTPICGPGGCGGGTSGSSGGGGGGGDGGGNGSGPPTATNRPECPCQQGPYVPPAPQSSNSNCGNGFLGAMCTFVNGMGTALDLLGGWEGLLKMGIGATLAAGCVVGTFGIGAVACAAIGMTIGTGFNLVDFAMAGGFNTNDPYTNMHNGLSLLINEAFTLGTGFGLPSDSWAGQYASAIIDGPQSPVVPYLVNTLAGGP